MESVTAIAIKAGVWLWDKFGKEFTEKISDDLLSDVKERWKKFRWNDAAHAYQSRVRELYSTIRILGKPEPVLLEGIYTDAFVLDKPTAMLRFDIEQLRHLQTEFGSLSPYVSRYSALDLARKHRRLFVLGKPGAGKTTFLKHLVLLACDGKLGFVPVFVSLHEWSMSGLSIMDFVIRQFEICEFPDAETFVIHMLKNGEATVLFDGLDEVTDSDSRRRELTYEIAAFTTKYSRSRFIVTCRIAATDYVFDKFTYVELADFSEAQIESFTRNWFGKSAKATDFLLELNKPQHRGLRELAQTPILLALLCLNYDETMSFPSRRVELYEEAIDALLKKWDASRSIKRDEVYKTLSIVRKRQLFAHVAASFFDEGKIFFDQSELVEQVEEFLGRIPKHQSDTDIDGVLVIKTIESQHGLFVERAHNIYSFSHLTIQEYFTAKYVEDNADNGSVRRLVEHHITDPSWREIFLLTASKLHNADGFFNHMKSRLDRIIRRYPKLAQLFEWAERKSQRDYTELQSQSLGRARALTIALSLDNGRVHAVDLLNGLLHDIDISLALDTHIKESLNWPKDMQPAAMEALNKVIEASDNRGLNDLSNSLRQLEWRGEQVTADWHTFDRRLREIMIEHRNIGHLWELERHERDTLQDYRLATILLLDCLTVAAVTNRHKVENGIYQAPRS